MLGKFWDWLRDEANQGALKIIGPAIAAVIAAGWAYFLWWDAQASKSTTSPEIIRICRSENSGCPQPFDIAIGCSDPDQWAREHCVKPDPVEMTYTHEGGHCGNNVYRVACYRKKRE